MRDSNKLIDPIAIIGMATRFPGSTNVEGFWQNLANGIESITHFADEQLIAAGVDPELLANPQYVKARSILEGVELFDAEFFGISPREAATMDPQQRVFLEVAWEAMEDAGYDSGSYDGSVGVYAGVGMNTYVMSHLGGGREYIERFLNLSKPGAYQLFVQNDKDFLSTRVAYKLNLRGPAMTVQTACSTSLVAVCQACQALLTGQCDMALAGGVSILLPQERGYVYEEGGMVSADGHCRAFDARAQGTVFGNGAGLVLLKRLDEALADGDQIYAVIKGFGLNNDGGSKSSYTAPTVDGHAGAIRMAQKLAGVSADSIGYVEAHGTGTPLGDPIEVAALTSAFRETTDRKNFCALGSVKTNIGHMDVAAGVAGLIKTALVLRHKQIPPTLHFTTPNPQIDFANSPFHVVTKLTPWESDATPRRAGVSSLGIGGTNAHVVLEEAPVAQKSGWSRPAQVLVFSAKSAASLEQETNRLGVHLKQRPGLNLADVAYTLQTGRREFPHRRVAVCRDVNDALGVLEKPDPKRVFTQHVNRKNPAVAFLFPGQGSQHVNMGEELYRTEPVFRETLDRCAETSRPLLGLDLRDVLYPPVGQEAQAAEQLLQTRVTQPALFAIEYSLAQLWMSWGVQPAAMIGHSVGEYVAACLADVFSAGDGLALLARRGQLIQDLPRGAMLAVRLPEAEVLPQLTPELCIAAVNSPVSCVVSGPFDAMEALEKQLTGMDATFTRLRTSHAFHSAMVDPMVAPFTEVVKGISLREPKIPYVSNLTAQWICATETTDPHYWGQHVRHAVRYSDSVALVLKDPQVALLEVGPGRVLSSLASSDPVRSRDHVILASLPTGNEADLDDVLTALGRLWMAGVTVDWRKFHGQERRHHVSLPTYPFERKRHWVELDREIAPVRMTEAAETPQPEAEGGVSEPGLPVAAGAADPSSVSQRLRKLLGDLSGRTIRDEDFDTAFVEMGFESLFLTQVSAAIGKSLGVKIAFRQLLGELSTLRTLSAHVEQSIASMAEAKVASPCTANDTNGSQPPAVTAPVSEQIAPLTEAQREIWLAAAMGAEASCAFNQSYLLRLRGDLRREALARAFQELVDRHEGLRATFPAAGDAQRIAPQLPVTPVFEDLASSTATEREARLTALLIGESSQPFDLIDGPVARMRIVKLSEQEHVVVLTVHHLVCDGRTIDLLVHELGELYSAECEGRKTQLPAAQSLCAYAEADVRQKEGGERAAAEKYWLEQFKQEAPTLELPADRPRPPVKTFRGGRVVLTMAPGLIAAAKQASARQGCTLFTALIATYYALLHRLTGQEDIVVGVPMACPGSEGYDRLAGHTVNFLAMRAAVSAEMSWGEYLYSMQQLVADAYEHRHFTYASLIQKLEVGRDRSRMPLLSAGFNLGYQRLQAQFFGLEVERGFNPHNFTNLDLNLDIFADDENWIELDCIYNLDLFDHETVKRWMGHYLTLLEAAVSNPAQRVGALPMLPESEKRQLLVEWNATEMEYLRDRRVHELVEDQAARRPAAIAAAFEGKQLTYAELNERANQLAHRLRGMGVGPDTLVAICTQRGLDMLIGLLAILKAGGGYLPLDPYYPAERIAFILQDARVAVLLTQSKLIATLPANGAKVVELDTVDVSAESRQNPRAGGTAEDLAYVIYTSGSTGKPKGVQIPHRAVVNFLTTMRREPGLGADDKLLAVTTLSFDIAGLELWLPLTTGAQVIIASREAAADGVVLAQLLATSGATVMQATPVTWRLLLEAGWTGKPLRKILCGGEALPPDLAEQLTGLGAEVWNLYGPTETTIWSAASRVASGAPVVLGKPIGNTTFYVVDSRMQPTPIGVAGELLIGGDGLARGYLNRPELTAEKFIADPFSAKPGARLYRTGDLARYLPDGNVGFLGRMDFQVKLRGFRIELSEIETVLRTHPDVGNAVVLVHEDERHEKRLVAYVVAVSDPGPTPAALRAHLQSQLPEYMVPSIYMTLRELPLTPNGKVNRKALPAPDQSRPDLSETFVAPHDSLEQQLANFWVALFNVERVGVRDNFFDLGGHSLLGVRLFAHIKKLTGKELPLVTLFQAPTIEQLAAILRQQGWKSPWASLVPIKAGGSMPPFYCVHGVGGTILEYLDLAKHLDADQPFYGLQAIGLDGKRPIEQLTVEQMAARYIEEIRAFQPRGPYYLGGSSFGGKVAYEMAQQLRAAGEEVAVLALFDTNGPGYPRLLPRRTAWRRRMDWWIDRAILHWENFRACEAGERMQYLRQKAARWKKQFRWKQQQLWDRMRGRLPLETFHQVRMMGFRANTAYDAKPYAGHVALFRATEQPRGIYEDRTLGWGSVLNGDLEIIDTPGHHGAIVREPRSRVLAAQLTEVLRRVKRGTESVHGPPDSGDEQDRSDENGNCADPGEHEAQLEIDFLSTPVRRAAAH
jgi:amino acid adenylation domain-containing protein